MALLEHDIEFGKISKKQKTRADSDAFSGQILKQFMGKQGITGNQFGKSSGMQQGINSKLGTMSNFMKSDLRIQASNDQFAQRKFSLDKKALRMATKYYELDKKVRTEEREFYHKTKDQNKKRHKKDIIVSIWRRQILKAAKKTKDNTDTLQLSQRLSFITKIAGGGAAAVGGVAGGVLGAITSPTRVISKAFSVQGNHLKKMNRERHSIELFKKQRFISMAKHASEFDKETSKFLKAQAKRIKRERKSAYKASVLNAQGIGPRQTKEDAKALKDRERQAIRDSRRIGGIFATDEEKAARKNLEREAKEFKVLRKRGFTEADIERHALEGTSRKDLVSSGKHRRRTSRILGSSGRAAGGVARFAGRGLAAAGPGLAVLAGAGLAVHAGRNARDILKESAMQIPVVQEIKQTFDDVADLLPKGVKDWFNKTAMGWFNKMWNKIGQTNAGGKMFATGSMLGNLFKAFTDLLDLIGQGVTKVFNILKMVFLNEKMIKIYKSFGTMLIEGGKVFIESATGIINFFTDIFGDKKASFGEAFMEHLYPPIKRFALDFVPKFVDYVVDVAKMIGSAVKSLIVGMVGSKVAGWFGIKADPSAMTKAATTIQAGQDRLREANADMAQMKRGAVTLRTYHSQGYETALEYIKEQERTGGLKHKEADALRSKLTEIRSAEKQVSSGKSMRREAKEKIKKESEKKVSISAKKTKSTPAPPISKTSPPQIDTSGTAEKGIFKSNSLNKDLADASRIYGIPLSFLQTMARIESRGNPNAVSPTGATGIFQFTRGTGTQYGLVGPGFDNRKNQRANVMAGAQLAQDNAKALKRAGLPATPAYLYLAHQQGVGGAKAITRAAMAGTEVSANIRKNMNHNGGKGLTPAQFLEKWDKKWTKMSGDTSGSSMGSIGSTAVATGAGGGGGFGSTVSSIASSVGSTVSTAASAAGSAAMGLAGAFGSAASSIIAAGTAALGGSGIGDKVSQLANNIMTKGTGFAQGQGNVPGFAEKAGAAAQEALKGAQMAAQGEMERMQMAMDKALTEDTSMQNLARTTSSASSYTQEMAHKEDKNLLSILEKQSDPFTQALAGAQNHFNSLVRSA